MIQSTAATLRPAVPASVAAAGAPVAVGGGGVFALPSAGSTGVGTMGGIATSATIPDVAVPIALPADDRQPDAATGKSLPIPVPMPAVAVLPTTPDAPLPPARFPSAPLPPVATSPMPTPAPTDDHDVAMVACGLIVGRPVGIDPKPPVDGQGLPWPTPTLLPVVKNPSPTTPVSLPVRSTIPTGQTAPVVLPDILTPPAAAARPSPVAPRVDIAPHPITVQGDEPEPKTAEEFPYPVEIVITDPNAPAMPVPVPVATGIAPVTPAVVPADSAAPAPIIPAPIAVDHASGDPVAPHRLPPAGKRPIPTAGKPTPPIADLPTPTTANLPDTIEPDGPDREDPAAVSIAPPVLDAVAPAPATMPLTEPATVDKPAPAKARGPIVPQVAAAPGPVPTVVQPAPDAPVEQGPDTPAVPDRHPAASDLPIAPQVAPPFPIDLPIIGYTPPEAPVERAPATGTPLPVVGPPMIAIAAAVPVTGAIARPNSPAIGATPAQGDPVAAMASALNATITTPPLRAATDPAQPVAAGAPVAASVPVAAGVPVANVAAPLVAAPVAAMPTPGRPVGEAPPASAPPLPPPPAATVGTTASAGIVFGAARLAAQRSEREDRILTVGAEALAATIAPAERLAVAAPQGGAQASLDMTDQRWPHAMVAHIVALRDAVADAANAMDTRIRLVPDALGGIDIGVRQDGDTLHVHFAADQPQTRALLQEAQPRLAEAAEARGLKLGQTSVGTDAGQNQQRQQQQSQQHQPNTPSARRNPFTASATTADTGDGRIA